MICPSPKCAPKKITTFIAYLKIGRGREDAQCGCDFECFARAFELNVLS